MEDTSDRPSLHVHEWFAVLAILGMMGLMTAFSLFNTYHPMPYETGTPHYLFDQEIEISIQGAVEQPGRFVVKKGSTVGQALSQAKLLPEADLRRLKLESKVRRNQLIKVPKIALITVTLEGAVETPGPVALPKNARLEDLIGAIAFHDIADLDQLRKKRRLKEGEVIKIPAKNLNYTTE